MIHVKSLTKACLFYRYEREDHPYNLQRVRADLVEEGCQIEWYSNGQKKREGSYLAYMVDIPARPSHKRILSKKHGAWRTWTQDGKVKSTHYYHKGTRCRPPNAPKDATSKTLPPCPPQ